MTRREPCSLNENRGKGASLAVLPGDNTRQGGWKRTMLAISIEGVDIAVNIIIAIEILNQSS